MKRSTLDILIGIVICLAGSLAAGAVYETNLVPNPTFQGSGGGTVGTVTGTVPDQWRGYGVNGGAVLIEVVPVAAGELYASSPATRAIRLTVQTFGGDQGIDHYPNFTQLIVGRSYHVEYYVKSGNTDGTDQLFNMSFPLFNEQQGYLQRAPGSHGNQSAGADWTKMTGPTFSDAEATLGHLSFRLVNDGGQNSLLIAMPDVQGPPDHLLPPDASALAQRTSWTGSDKLAGTTYFYWYRWPNNGFTNPDQTDSHTNHLVNPELASWESVPWHKGEMLDVLDAGLDMIWPVYWGYPGELDGSWSVEGLGPLQDALDELAAEGDTPPKVGMFYDTSTLRYDVNRLGPDGQSMDLTTDEGKDFFYRTVRSFFCNVHPRHWACIDGRPVVVLYTTQGATHDQSSIDYVTTWFAAEFGGITPYVIADYTWTFSSDGQYRWGAAFYGPQVYGDVAAVGPGYNDSNVAGRITPIRMREDGNFYRWSWLQILQSSPRIVHVETWNEMFEATEICASYEYGRQYIDLTAHYIAHFKAGTVPDETVELEFEEPIPRPPPSGDGSPYDGATIVEIRAENGAVVEEGIEYREVGDGALVVVEHGGQSYLRTVDTERPYAYFAVDDAFYYDQHRRVLLTVEYLDVGDSTVTLQYDSYDPTGIYDGSYTTGMSFQLNNQGINETQAELIEDARLINRQNAGADFRFRVYSGLLYIKSVRLEMIPLPQPVLQVTAADPAPASVSTGPPQQVVIDFSLEVDAATVDGDSVKLVRSVDGTPGNYLDELIVPAAITVSGSRVTLDLDGVDLPEDTYQLTLWAQWLYPILDINGQVLDGRFDGTFPSGDGTGGGNFVYTFAIDYADADFDHDGYVDSDDLGAFFNCLTAPGIESTDPQCASADLDGDGDVDQGDFARLQRCYGGAVPVSDPACAD